MKILMVTPELSPWVKVGGLADMVAALSKELSRRGHDVRVVCPLYGSIRPASDWVPHSTPLSVPLGPGEQQGRVWESHQDGTLYYFIEHHDYFDRWEIYTGPWGAHGDNDRRFIFLGRGALELARGLSWYPDVVHVHDWPTALVPVYLNTVEAGGPLGQAASVLTLHNLEHQGHFHRGALDFAGIPQSEFREDGLASYGQVNFLKGGIYHATKLTTVSPSYSREILTPDGGGGLDDVLRFRAADLIGVLNGIDTEVWNPETDPHLPAGFSAGDLSGKAVCKARLQEETGLEVLADIPLFSVVSRFAGQKGLDLLAGILPAVLEAMRVQFIVLGSGDRHLEETFTRLAERYPGRMAVKIGFDEALAHRIEAGSDVFVMPSRFEPCGLNQMYSMRYGTLPLARATGGLLDTVEQYVEEAPRGTGFLFDEPSQHALYYTVGWACATYYDRPEEFQGLRLRGMAKDFSWTRSARRYENVYRWAVQHRTGRLPEEVAAG